MMNDIQNKLEVITDAVLKTVPEVKMLYLFGSHAYGNPTEDSDIDIYGVVNNMSNQQEINDAVANIVCYLCRDKNILNVDLLLVDEKKFMFYKDNHPFERKIYNDGVLLYGHK